MPSIKLQGHTIEYSIRESKRAKRINMRIHAEKGLEVVYPVGVKKPKPHELLEQNQAWVLSTLDKVQTRLENQFQRRYQQGEIFRFLGENKTLNLIQKAHGKSIVVKLSDETIDVSLPSDKSINDTDAIQQAVENFYRKEAKSYLTERTLAIADQLGFEVNRIVIKNQKTRWGSCSNKSNLNLNLRLMMTPPDAIDYIIIHELCHLVHMNHSKAFWKLVGKHCPDYKYWRKWFKAQSQYLVL